MPLVVLAAAAWMMVLVAPARALAQTTETPSLGDLLTRASVYVERFKLAFSTVVAEEHYAQQAPGRSTMAGSGRNMMVTQGITERRTLVSDFLLVKAPGEEAWLPFRDVYQVDGAPVRDRQDRLTKLFLKPSRDTWDQAEDIVREGSRYNIGNVVRTINTPLGAIVILEAARQAHFRFTLDKRDASAGPDVWIVRYQETAAPTVVTGVGGKPLYSRGRFWIQAGTGRIVRSELMLQDGLLGATITVLFAPDQRFGVDAPAEMREEYRLPGGDRITGKAEYRGFRRFTVDANEAVSDRPLVTEPLTGMALVEIAPGRFTMGSHADEAGRRSDEQAHAVELTSRFFLGRYEVTEQQWRAVMPASRSAYADCGDCPVENVSVDDIEQFLAKLNAKAPIGTHYRLPSEAEWEFACRAGSQAPFGTGPTLGSNQANVDGRHPYGGALAGGTLGRPIASGSFAPNAWSLGDMHGNVAEWTADWYAPYDAATARDPQGPASGSRRVVRGGGWSSDAEAARCAARQPEAPSTRTPNIGFRVAATIAR